MKIKLVRVFCLCSYFVSVQVLGGAVSEGHVHENPAIEYSGEQKSEKSLPTSRDLYEHDRYISQILQENNVDEQFPSLAYPGVKSFVWGMTIQQLSETVVSDLKKNPDHKNGWTIRSSTPYFEDVTEHIIFVFDDQNKLSEIKRTIKVSDVDVNRRFNKYNAIKKAMFDVYRQPSHALKPDQGASAHNQLIKSNREFNYHLEWHGWKSVAALTYSPRTIIISYREANHDF